MEREIKVVVDVNDEIHATLIREDIQKVIKTRTTHYFLGHPEEPEKHIDQLFKELSDINF